MPSGLPTLTVNRAFMTALLQAKQTPCCGLGMVEVDGRQCGFLALRPGEVIPNAVTEQGFNFGHQLLGDSDFEVIRFSFDFYGFQTYHVLINPNNPLVQAVLKTMLESGDYFFFALDESSGSVTAFRTEIGYTVLTNIRNDWDRILASTTTLAQYAQAVVSFASNPPEPQGKLLHWVCQDNIDFLDLSEDRWDLRPMG